MWNVPIVYKFYISDELGYKIYNNLRTFVKVNNNRTINAGNYIEFTTCSTITYTGNYAYPISVTSNYGRMRSRLYRVTDILDSEYLSITYDESAKIGEETLIVKYDDNQEAF